MRAEVVILLLLMLTMSIFRFGVASGAKTIFVPTDFPSIQDAIDNATEGDTIFVYNGTYVENVVVSKAVSLVGENKTITSVDGGGVGAVFKVLADNVSISGFTIANGGLAESGAGILLFKVRYANLSDNIVFSSYEGIGLVNSSYNIVQGNYVSECNMSVYLNSSDSNVLQENTFTNAPQAGIYMSGSSSNTIERNAVMNCGVYGVYLKISFYNKMSGNGITGCENGFMLEYSGGNTLSTNDIGLNRFNFGVNGASLSDFIQDIDASNKVDGRSIYYLVNKKGVSLNGSLSQDVGYLAAVNSSNIRAKGLTLSGNNEGFLCVYSADCLVESSRVANNRRAIFAYYSPQCGIINDNFVNNTESVSFISSANGLVRNSSIVNCGGFGLRFESSENSIAEGNLIEECVGGGLNAYSSANCSIAGNTVAANGLGILVQVSNGTRVTGNTVRDNTADGVYFSTSDASFAQDNNVTGNGGYGIFFLGSRFGGVVNNYIGNNTRSGIYVYTCSYGQVNSNKIKYNDAGINFQSCQTNTIHGNEVVGNTHEGIFLIDSPNADISFNNVFDSGGEGMCLQNSGNSSVDNNVVYGNAQYGLLLQSSPYVDVLSCNISSNNWDGISLRGSNNSRILNNTIDANHDAGCTLFPSHFVMIMQNNITGNKNGVRLLLSNNNTVSGNKIMLNIQNGIDILNSTGNKICGNSLINNTQNVNLLYASGNRWDDGYPNGGNYWSNYTGPDSYWGSGQNRPGSDGIIDVPYVLNLDNIDRYPLAVPSRFHDLTLENITLPSREVYVGWVFPVNVTVRNSGWYVEDMNMTAYYDGVSLGRRVISNLTVSGSLVLSLTWNTSNLLPGHTYDVKAAVSIIMGETHTGDNVYDFGIVKVKMVGDVNNDGKISILDIAAIATGFDSRIGQPRYKLNYDMNLDFVINIVDISMAARNYGKSYS